MMRQLVLGSGVLVVVLAACGDDSGVGPSPVPDAGPADAARDAVGARDAGDPDAARPGDGSVDVGVRDAARDATAGDAGVAGLGTATPMPASCGTGALPNTTCQRLRVSCPGVPDLDVQVRVTPAAAAASPRGTVVFGTGGAGTGFYESDSVARSMLGRVTDEGFVVVQRAWDSAWEEGPGGYVAVACRYATLLTWIHEAQHTGGAFCATGNSGGSSEVSYALSHFGRGAILDLAVPTGGPPMGRLDHGCLDAMDPTWRAGCAAHYSDHGVCAAGGSCAFSAGARMTIDAAYTPETHCADADESFRATLRADSVAAPGARRSYPDTRVHFIYGDGDCTEAVSLGLEYAEAVTSEREIEVAAGTGHGVFRTVTGATAIFDALHDGCIER